MKTLNNTWVSPVLVIPEVFSCSAIGNWFVLTCCETVNNNRTLLILLGRERF